jgi:hypothetical protein
VLDLVEPVGTARRVFGTAYEMFPIQLWGDHLRRPFLRLLSPPCPRPPAVNVAVAEKRAAQADAVSFLIRRVLSVTDGTPDGAAGNGTTAISRLGLKG